MASFPIYKDKYPFFFFFLASRWSFPWIISFGWSTDTGIAEELVLLTRLPFPQVTLSLRKTRRHSNPHRYWFPRNVVCSCFLFLRALSFFSLTLLPRPTNHQLRRDERPTNFLIFIRRGEKGRKALESWKNMRCENAKLAETSPWRITALNAARAKYDNKV